MIQRRFGAAPSAGGDDANELPEARSITIDAPYRDPKALLLFLVAEVYGCQVLWYRRHGFATVIGVRDGLDMVESLFTSLLAQVTAAIEREGAKRDMDGRSRTRSFRQSFLIAYARRIGERLQEAYQDTNREGSTNETTPTADYRYEQAITDWEGCAAGRAAAAAADLATSHGGPVETG